MRIAIALINPNVLGGKTKFASDLCAMLRRLDYNVALCCWKRPNENSYDALREVENVYMPSMIGGRIARFNVGMRAILSIQKCVKDFNPDVIISADIEPVAFSSIPNNIIKVHYCHFPTEAVIKEHTYISLLGRVPYWHQHYKQLPKLDYIVCNSYYTEKITRILWSSYLKTNSIRTIYPATNVNKFQVKKEKLNQLCYIGRIDVNKGIEHIIKAFIGLYDEYGCSFKIVGSTDMHRKDSSYAKQITIKVNELREKAYPIEIKTDVSYNEIIETLLSSKIMLSYNPNEHFGIVPIEAQAAGCVPIVADGGGQQETVLHNETGFRMSSPIDFSVYVKELLTKDSLFQEMSERGKRWANNFSYEEIEVKWNNLLVSLIDAKHSRARVRSSSLGLK